MYSQDTIDALVARIGWAPPQPPTAIVLSDANAHGTSGRLVSGFHALAIVENVDMTMPLNNITTDTAPTNDQLNAYLLQLKTQAALKVLSRVFDSNPLAAYRTDVFGKRADISGTDWSAVVMGRASAFDNALGYQIAYDTLGMMLTSQRSNYRERSIADRGMLTAAANGIKNAEGRAIAPGLLQKLEDAYSDLITSLFPQAKKTPRAVFVTPW